MSILSFYEKYLESHYANPSQCVSLGYLSHIAMHMCGIPKYCNNQQVLAYTEQIHFGVENCYFYPPTGPTKNLLHLKYKGKIELIELPFNVNLEMGAYNIGFGIIFLGMGVIDTFSMIHKRRRIIKALKQDCQMKKIHGYNKYSKKIKNNNNNLLINHKEYDRIRPPFSYPEEGYVNRNVSTFFTK